LLNLNFTQILTSPILTADAHSEAVLRKENLRGTRTTEIGSKVNDGGNPY